MQLLNKYKVKKIIDNKRALPINDLTKSLKQNDILLFRWQGKKDFLGGSIGYFTNSPYSHAEVYLFNGFGLSASSTGVIYDDLFNSKREGQYIDLFRLNRALTRNERLVIQAKASQSLLKPYAYNTLFLFPFASKKQIARWSKDNAYICSEVTSWVYKEAGIDLVPDKESPAEAPADLGKSQLLLYCGTYHIPDGMLMFKDKRSQFLEFQQYSKSVIAVGNIIKALSDKDEGYTRSKNG